MASSIRCRIKERFWCLSCSLWPLELVLLFALFLLELRLGELQAITVGKCFREPLPSSNRAFASNYLKVMRPQLFVAIFRQNGLPCLLKQACWIMGTGLEAARAVEGRTCNSHAVFAAHALLAEVLREDRKAPQCCQGLQELHLDESDLAAR